MRATRHNARGKSSSSSGFSNKHNDRNFDLAKSKNIKTEKTQNNIYWNCYERGFYSESDKENHRSFSQVEESYYKRFKHQWEAQCERNNKARHSERNKSFEEWCKSKRYCPEETVMQIGNAQKHATNKETYAIMREYLAYEQQFAKEHNNCYQVLDAAFHFDEATPHIQIRRVWQSKNANGLYEIGQNKALEQSGLELPEPDKPINAKNNYKITFDKLMRDKFIEICEAHGFQIEKQPQERTTAMQNLEQDKLIYKKKSSAMRQLKDTRSKLSEAQEELQNAQEDINTLEEQKRALKSELERLESERNEVLQDKQAFARYQEFLKLKEEKKRRERNNRILQNGIDMANELESGSSKGMEL